MRLRTSDPDRPGRRRVRHGRGFRYLDAHGDPLGAEDRARTVGRAIPPAWRDVRICPWPGGRLQAVGTDAAGRRQHLHHEEFRRRRKAANHAHVRRVGDHLGNTPAVCRASPVGPLVVERFEEGVTIASAPEGLGEDGGPGRPATHGPVERAVLRLPES
ncbi:DNA topoisomerase IB [Streptomyces filamentosus]